jgi:hypothetical protein
MNVLVFPNLDSIVTTARDKPPLLPGSRIGADQATGRCSRCPADRVYAHAVRMEDLVSPAVIPELENTDVAI